MDYEKVNALWTSVPPITRKEAERAVKKLRKKFGLFPWHVRRSWISLEGHRLDKGWPRMVHDLSHRHARSQFPTARPHGPHHARIEYDMIQYVLAQGWLDGKLKSAVPPPRTTDDKLARLRVRKLLWESKRKRAENALKKLARQIKYQEHRLEVAS